MMKKHSPVLLILARSYTPALGRIAMRYGRLYRTENALLPVDLILCAHSFMAARRSGKV